MGGKGIGWGRQADVADRSPGIVDARLTEVCLEPLAISGASGDEQRRADRDVRQYRARSGTGEQGEVSRWGALASGCLRGADEHGSAGDADHETGHDSPGGRLTKQRSEPRGDHGVTTSVPTGLAASVLGRAAVAKNKKSAVVSMVQMETVTRDAGPQDRGGLDDAAIRGVAHPAWIALVAAGCQAPLVSV